MQLIDSHCHLDFEAFDGDRDIVLRDAAATSRNSSEVLGLHERRTAAAS